MGAAENRDVVRRLVADAVNADRSDLLAGFVHADVRVHPGTPGAAPDTEGIDGLSAAFARFHTAFTDLHIEIEDVVAEGDRVAARWTATGTHADEFAGVAATGRSVRWGGIDLFRLVDGKIAEWWRNDDFIGLTEQLRPPMQPG